MPFSPRGGLIGSTERPGSGSHPARARVDAEHPDPMSPFEPDSTLVAYHRLLHPNLTGIQQSAQRVRVMSSDNSPELLLWGVASHASDSQDLSVSGLGFLDQLIGTVEAPEDWAAEHDHYLYGTPRKHER
jgi:hypothetical protein